MKRLILLAIIMTGALIQAYGQLEGYYRHYLVSPILVNPAYTGFEDQHNLLFNYNSQLSNFSDTGVPQLATASYNGPVSDQIGLGLMISNDSEGSYGRNRTQLSYAFKFELEGLDLALGLATSFERFRLKSTALLDPRIDIQDPVLIDAAAGSKVFDASFGIHGKTDDFYFGLASPNLIRARVNKDPNVPNETVSGILDYFVAYGGYRWEVEDNNFAVEPSLMARKLINSPFMLDVNAKVIFLEDQLIGGVTYTLGGGDRFSILLGTQLTNFNIHYSYTSSFQQSQQYHAGGHEVSIGFSFGNNRLEEED